MFPKRTEWFYALGFFMLPLVAMTAELFAHLPGDVYIVGLFEIETEKGGKCDQIKTESVMTLEATRWYVNQLNLARTLPFKIGFKGFKTCGLPGKAADVTWDVIANLRRDNKYTGDIVVGFIGPSTTSEVKSVAPLLSTSSSGNNFLHISPSASAISLADRTKFPSFYRTIPDNSKQIQTTVLLMKALSWNRIGIIYENDIDANNCAFLLKHQAEENSICISKMNATIVSDSGDVFLQHIHRILDGFMANKSPIGGVVALGKKRIVHSILLALNNANMANVPLFILPKSVGLADDVCKSLGSGPIFTKSKGSLIMSPPYTEITTFTDYWLSLFTDMSLFEKHVASNPWLNNVFETHSRRKCYPAVNTCEPFDVGKASKELKIMTVEVKYALVAVHTMVKVLKQVFNKICSSDPSRCYVGYFKKQFSPHMMLTEMMNMTINFGTDFGVSVEPLSSSKYEVTFGNSSEPVSQSDDEIYHVYNFRKHITGEFRFLKVGSLLSNGELDLNISAVKDYDVKGDEMSFPYMRKGQCPAGEKCEECIKYDIAKEHIHIPGDLYVIGIVPIQTKSASDPFGCGSFSTNGYQMALALQYSLEVFHSSPEFKYYRTHFNNKRVGLVVLNSCDNSLAIARKILDLHQLGLLLENGDRLDLSNKILGFVGASTDVSVEVATQLTRLNKVQISYCANNAILSDRSKYPYFLRVVPPVSVQADAILETVKMLGGKYIQVIYSKDIYGNGGVDALRTSARIHKVCIAQYIEVEASDNYRKYYDLLLGKAFARIIVTFLSHSIWFSFANDLSKQLKRGEFQFIGSDSWRNDIHPLDNDKWKGSFSFTWGVREPPDLKSYIKQKLNSKTQTDSLLTEYIQKRQDCFFDWSFDKTFTKPCSSSTPLLSDSHFQIPSVLVTVAESVFTLLVGSAEFFKKTCDRSDVLCLNYIDNPSGLVDCIKNVSLDIDGMGKRKIFDDNGNGKIGFQIYNIQADYYDSNRLKYVKVGSYDQQHGLKMNLSAVQFPNRNKITAPCPNRNVCSDCLEEDWWEEMSWKEWLLIASAVAVGLLLVIVGVLSKRKHTPQTPADTYLTPVSFREEEPENIDQFSYAYDQTDLIDTETSF